MMFTPMTRRTLTTAQQEQERLGHEAVEPAHLLLALLKVGKVMGKGLDSDGLDLGLPIWLEVIGRAEYMRQLSLG